MNRELDNDQRTPIGQLQNVFTERSIFRFSYYSNFRR